MRKRGVVFLGVDLAPPGNEMLYKIVRNVSNNMAEQSFFLSVMKNKKKLSCSSNLQLLGSSIRIFTYIISPPLICWYLFYLVVFRQYRVLNIIWSGFGAIDTFLCFYARFFLRMRVIYTITNNKQLSYGCLKFCNKIVVFSREAYKKIKTNGKVSFIHPATNIKIKERNYNRKNEIIFLTVPVFKKNFEHRGVYDFFKICKLASDRNIDTSFVLLNRWFEGAKILDKLKNNYELTNLTIVNDNIADIHEVLRQSSIVINLDLGNAAPAVSMSVVESLSCGCPVIGVNDSTFFKEIDLKRAGILVESIEDVVSALEKILNNKDFYTQRAYDFAEARLLYEKFIGKYLNVLQN